MRTKLGTMRRSTWGAALSGLLAATLAGAACTSTTRPADDLAAVDPQARAFLRHIPADTPYALVGAGAGARELLEKVAPVLEPVLELVGRELAAHIDPTLAEALALELRGRLSPAGLDQLGIDVDARYAIYGLGLLPALRVQVREPAALEAALWRVAQAAGPALVAKRRDGYDYWELRAGSLAVLVAVVEDQLVVGMAPSGLRDRVFALLLGQELPARDLGSSARYQQLAEVYGLGERSAGFIDGRVLAEALLGEGDALNRDVAAALAPELAAGWPGLGADCKQQIRSLVALAPRVVFGSEALGGDGFTGKLVLELRPDLAQELMSMRAAVPGLTPAQQAGAMVAIGAGLDLDRALRFLADRGGAVQRAPYGCPTLAPLNAANDRMLARLAELPGAARKARGFTFVLEELADFNAVPTAIRGFATLAHGDPKLVVAELRTTSGLEALDMPDDGTVRAGPGYLRPAISEFAYGALAGRGLVFAIGEDSQARASALLSAPELAEPPLLRMHYDARRLAALLGKRPVDGDDMRRLLAVLAVLDSLGHEALATPRGLEVRTQLKLR